MHKYNTYLYSLFICLLFVACKAQQTDKKQYASIYTDLQAYKLKGPVKMIRSNFKKNYEQLTTKDERKIVSAHFSVYPIINGYFDFDRNGFEKTHYSLRDSINEIHFDTIYNYGYNYTDYVYRYEYNKNDYKEKLKIKQTLNTPKWVFNPYQLKLNRQSYKAYDVIVKKDSSYKEQQYIYIYKTDATGKIINQIMEHHFDNDLDGVSDSSFQYYTVDYKYNAKNQLVKKVYHLNPKIFDDRYYLDHNLEVSYSKETPIEVYTYNDAGNLTSVYTYLNPQKTVLAYSAEYFYNDSNQLVRLKRRKATGMMGVFNKHFKRLNEFFFNDKGDVIKINSYENDEKTIHATYLYEYKKYDKYGNWLYMQMRIKDIPTKDPIKVVNRIIEYYKD